MSDFNKPTGTINLDGVESLEDITAGEVTVDLTGADSMGSIKSIAESTNYFTGEGSKGVTPVATSDKEPTLIEEISNQFERIKEEGKIVDSDYESDSNFKLLVKNLQLSDNVGIAGFVVKKDKGFEITLKTSRKLDPSGNPIPNPNMEGVIADMKARQQSIAASGYKASDLYQHETNLVGRLAKPTGLMGTIFSLPSQIIEKKVFNIIDNIKKRNIEQTQFGNERGLVIVPPGDEIYLAYMLFRGVVPEVYTAPKVYYKRKKLEKAKGVYTLKLVTRTVNKQKVSVPVLTHSVRQTLFTPENYVAANRPDIVNLNTASQEDLAELNKAYGLAIDNRKVFGNNFRQTATPEAMAAVVKTDNGYDLAPLKKGNFLTYDGWFEWNNGEPVVKVLDRITRKEVKTANNGGEYVRPVTLSCLDNGFSAESKAFLAKIGMEESVIKEYIEDYSSKAPKKNSALVGSKAAELLDVFEQDTILRKAINFSVQNFDLKY